MIRRLLPLAFVVGASAAQLAGAQSILDIGARVAPQYHSYSIESPTNVKISEFAVPLFVLVPITSSFSFDVGSSYVRAQVDQSGATKATSTINGLTDTQVRANYVLGNDFVVLTAGVNIPTGKNEIPVEQQLAASLIGNDFLAFPISNMGTGFGGTGGIAIARPVGDWNFGGGLSVRRSAQYNPVSPTGGITLHYQPGNEYRARLGLDRAIGTGRVTLGVTYSSFGDDNYGGSIYNTGNRLLSQVEFDNTYGPGRVTLAGWDLYRASGTIADIATQGQSSIALGNENIANGMLSYGIPLGGSAILEPNVEGRLWTQEGLSTSGLGTFGLRMQADAAGLTFLPSVGYSIGQLAAQTTGGLNTTANMTGWHATLAIRLR
jgi:hypothetical protein